MKKSGAFETIWARQLIQAIFWKKGEQSFIIW